MLLALLASLQTAAPATPPQDWTRLPALRWKQPPRNDESTSRYVRDEVNAGRCAAALRSGHAAALSIDVAVLADAGGRIRAVVPRAINCPTVEQYTVGLIQRMARDNLDTAGQTGGIWYRTAMTYSWSG